MMVTEINRSVQPPKIVIFLAEKLDILRANRIYNLLDFNLFLHNENCWYNILEMVNIRV